MMIFHDYISDNTEDDDDDMMINIIEKKFIDCMRFIFVSYW